MGWLKIRKTKRQKRVFSAFETLRRKFLRFKIITLSVIAVLAISLFAVVYMNWDYLLFKTLISRHYIHTETLDEMFATHLGIDPQGRYSRYFDNLVISIVTSEIRQTGGDPYTFLLSPTQRTTLDERIVEEAARANVEEIATGIGLLTLPNISPYTQDFVRNNRNKIAEFDSLILDLRGNLGGELSAAQAIAGHFLPRGDTINYEQARWNLFSRQRRSRGRQTFEFDQIVILQDAFTASSAEVLIGALQANLENVTTIGETSFGKAVGQVMIPLRRGFAVNSTAILIQTAAGEDIHGIGIVPDIAESSTNALDAAVEFLQGVRP